MRGLPEAHWVRQALRTAQARHRELEVAGLAAFLEEVPVAEGIGAKLNRLLLGFFEAEVLPQAMRAAELGIDPHAVVGRYRRLLRRYTDALGRPMAAGTDHARRHDHPYPGLS